MYVIKMENDKTLFPTIETNIFEGESGVDNILFLIPRFYETTNITELSIVCQYRLPDNTEYVERLTSVQFKDNEEFYCYKLPISSRITSLAGKIELWLTATDDKNHIVLKTGATIIKIFQSVRTSKHVFDEDVPLVGITEHTFSVNFPSINSVSIISGIYDSVDKKIYV